MVYKCVRTAPTYCFAPLFQKRKPSGLSEKTPFLFGNFFIAALVPKKKWIKSLGIDSFVALFINSEILLSLFLLSK